MADDKITYLHQTTTMNIPVERVVDGAKEADLKHILVIGWDKEDVFYMAGDTSDQAEINLMIDIAKIQILKDY